MARLYIDCLSLFHSHKDTLKKKNAALRTKDLDRLVKDKEVSDFEAVGSHIHDNTLVCIKLTVRVRTNDENGSLDTK